MVHNGKVLMGNMDVDGISPPAGADALVDDPQKLVREIHRRRRKTKERRARESGVRIFGAGGGGVDGGGGGSSSGGSGSGSDKGSVVTSTFSKEAASEAVSESEAILNNTSAVGAVEAAANSTNKEDLDALSAELDRFIASLAMVGGARERNIEPEDVAAKRSAETLEAASAQAVEAVVTTARALGSAVQVEAAVVGAAARATTLELQGPVDTKIFWPFYPSKRRRNIFYDKDRINRGLAGGGGGISTGGGRSVDDPDYLGPARHSRLPDLPAPSHGWDFRGCASAQEAGGISGTADPEYADTFGSGALRARLRNGTRCSAAGLAFDGVDDHVELDAW